MEMTFKQLDSASYYKIQKNENEKWKNAKYACYMCQCGFVTKSMLNIYRREMKT